MATQSSPNSRVIAIGDIHGCDTAFHTLLEGIELQVEDTLVILGDVIDRGPGSRTVLDLLLELREQCQLTCILGNHEQMLLDVVDGKMPLRQWLGFGGEETLDSYQKDGTLGSFSEQHFDWIRTWGDYYETEEHFFAHGNFQPKIDLGEQAWEEMRWLSLHQYSPGPHKSGKRAVLGHTSNKAGKIVDAGHLVCIDTYCHGGGWLTALEARTGHVWQANESGEMRQKKL
ncbi:metallophosphoesterase family protein [Adhaeretor mobilis]|uniref:Serine/threonine-protein phosphatase 1 n=1 Tax=Adhaeretor mobilis TaxID=1930276 RepID=A0A517MY93_9BACT|nr:metallophosphoesterase family protein [Adhaeretor mobilis]QDS99852.1 Serine/threonine-protein phosphatase 1 [Adhaeretor mobilis]